MDRVNMIEILKASNKFPNQRLPSDFKDIEGNVKVTFIPGKGRGLIAHQVFNPGDIILGHRAMEIIFPENSENSKSSSSLLNKVKRFRCLKEALAKLAENDEDFKEKLYFLHAGPKLGFVEENKSVQTKFAKVSLQRIEGIIVVNGFQGPSVERDGVVGGPFGLWYLPSFINHDCSKNNANWSIVNDFMFVRASKSISVGDEILISYIDPDQPFSVRQELFMKHDFICTCKLCSLEKQEGETIRNQRDEILTSFKGHIDAINTIQPDLELLSSILEGLKALRSSPMKNPFVLQPLMQLGLAFYEKGDFDKAIPIFEDAIDVCRYFPQYSSVATTLSIAVLKCYLTSLETLSDGNNDVDIKNKIKEWICNLKEWMLIQYGCQQGEVEEWFEILKLVMPSFSVQIEQYLK